MKRRAVFVSFSILSLLWMAVIYAFSAQDSADSSIISRIIASTFVEGPKTVENIKEKKEKESQTPEAEKQQETVDVNEKELTEIEPAPEITEQEINVIAQSEQPEKSEDKGDVSHGSEEVAAQNQITNEIKKQTPADDTSVATGNSEQNNGEKQQKNEKESKPKDKYVPIRMENFEKPSQYLRYSRVYYAVRKLAHCIVFAVLGGLTYLAVGSYKSLPAKLIRPAWISVPLCFVYAVSDEIHQKFVKGRGCRFSDILIDVCGAVVGTLIAAGILAIILKLKTKKESLKVENEN